MSGRARTGRTGWAMVVALLPVAALAQEAEGVAGAWAGGGYESNLARASNAQSSIGDWSMDLGAMAGGAWANDTFLLGGGANYRGQVFATATELSSHALGGHLLGTAAPADWLLLGLTPSAAYVAQGDPARNGARVNARGFVRVAPSDWLRVRAGYGYLLREAADPTFSTRTHEVSATVTVQPKAWLELNAGYAWLSGTEIVYRDTGGVTTGGSGGGRRAGAGGFSVASGGTLVPVQVDSTLHVISGGAEVTLPAGFYVALDGSWARGLTPLGAWSSWTLAAQAGWDLP